MRDLSVMKARHSVRQYKNQPIPEELRQELDLLCQKCNQTGNLNMQIIYDDEECFQSILAHYGKFRGVQNYIAVVGKKSPSLQQRAGYYGEQLVLKAQALGLNTCWVALTYGKGKCQAKIGPDEKLVCVIALGYGETQGTPHKNKPVSEIAPNLAGAPDWYCHGIEAVLLAPTAVNQQKFRFTRNGSQVSVSAGKRPYCKLDLGIARYHFEYGAGRDNFIWKTE